MTENISIERSSGNVFGDLGFKPLVMPSPDYSPGHAESGAESWERGRPARPGLDDRGGRDARAPSRHPTGWCIVRARLLVCGALGGASRPCSLPALRCASARAHALCPDQRRWTRSMNQDRPRPGQCACAWSYIRTATVRERPGAWARGRSLTVAVRMGRVLPR